MSKNIAINLGISFYSWFDSSVVVVDKYSELSIWKFFATFIFQAYSYFLKDTFISSFMRILLKVILVFSSKLLHFFNSSYFINHPKPDSF